MSGTPIPDLPGLRELRCCGCGYLLRGLAAEGRCPECGRAVVETIDRNLARHERRAARWAHWSNYRVSVFGLRPDPPLSAETCARRCGMILGAILGLTAQLLFCVVLRRYDRLPDIDVPSSYLAAGVPATLFALATLLVICPVRSAGATRFERAVPWLARVAGCGPLLAVCCQYLADHVVPWFDGHRYDNYARASMGVGYVATVLLFDQIACLAARAGNRLLVIVAKLVCYVSFVPGPWIFGLPAANLGPLAAAVGLLPSLVLTGFAATVAGDIGRSDAACKARSN